MWQIRKSIAEVTIVGAFFLCAHTKGEAATLTCASVSEILIIDAITPQVPHADVPTKSKFVREDVYTRSMRPNGVWQHCQSLQGPCGNIISLSGFQEQSDGTDNDMIYSITIQPYSAGTFITPSISRLVITYTTDQPECLSQATYFVLAGSSNEFRLYVPSNAKILTFRDWLRDVQNGKPWIVCDDYMNKPSGTGIVNACRSPYTFQFYPSDEADASDNAVGIRFVCSAKPDNNWVDIPRICRSAVVYTPNAQFIPGMPSELAK